MNRIPATVETIESNDVATFIELSSGEVRFRLIRSKLPGWVATGDKVYCTFKEGSVCVSKECPGRISIENRFPGVLQQVRQNGALCELTFESDVGPVVSLITSRAYEELGLCEGCKATMLLRGVDITLEPAAESLESVIAGVSRTEDAN